MALLDKVVLLEQEADAFGFRWETTDQIMAQIESECAEISEHLHAGFAQANQAELQEEIGDLLHAVFSLCVFFIIIIIIINIIIFDGVGIVKIDK